MSDNIMITENTDATEPTEVTATPEPTETEPTETAPAAATEDTPAEKPKPVRVRRPKATPAPKAESKKDEPKDTGEAEKSEPGPVRKSNEPPAEIRKFEKFRRYLNPTTQTLNKVKDLRENPVQAGSWIAPSLVLNEAQMGELEKAKGRCDGPAWRNYEAIIFLGGDKAGNLDFVIGTKGDALVRLRLDKADAVRISNVKLTDVEKTYYLGFMFDDEEFEHWNLERPADKPQWMLGVRAAEAAKAKAEAARKRREEAAAEKEAQEAKAAETVKPEPKKKVRVPRSKRTPAAASA